MANKLSSIPKQEPGKIQRIPGQFIKYKNRLIPGYQKESFDVWINEHHGVSFDSFENAVIFSQLIQLRKDVGFKLEKINIS